MELILLFIFGTAVGSFLNVLIDRLPHDEQVFKGRSYCDNCKKTLKWYDMVPVLSFILLGRKCRYCRSPLSYYYPVVEILTGILFVLTYVYSLQFSTLNSQLSILYYLFIVSSLIVVFFADLKYGIIPDKIIFPAIGVSILYQVLSIMYPPIFISQFSFLNSILSAFGACGVFLALFLITRGKGMGFGDVKLAFLMGLDLGFPSIIVGVYIAFLTGAFVGIILILGGKKKLKGSTIPFGPFLVFGTVISMFFGNQILQLASRLLSFSL